MYNLSLETESAEESTDLLRDNNNLSAIEETTHYGDVALVGLPNVGKSTLMNALLGRPLSIVCHKAQTTRRAVHGLLHLDHTQLSVHDTPGWVAEPKSSLHHMLRRSTLQSIHQAHLIIWVIDARMDVDDPRHTDLRHVLRQYAQKVRPDLFEDKFSDAKILQTDANHVAYDADYATPVSDSCSQDRSTAQQDANHDKPHFMVMFNKVDCVHKNRLLQQVSLLEPFWREHPVWMLSARQALTSTVTFGTVSKIANTQGQSDDASQKNRESDRLQRVLCYWANLAPQGVWRYASNQHTTDDQHVLLQDITRRYLLERLHDELPYELTVCTDHVTKRGAQYYVNQRIILNHQRHKKMVLGGDGAVLSYVRRHALIDMQNLLGAKRVILDLHVSCDAQWLQRARVL